MHYSLRTNGVRAEKTLFPAARVRGCGPHGIVSSEPLVLPTSHNAIRWRNNWQHRSASSWAGFARRLLAVAPSAVVDLRHST
jgi:hypothetical protein